MIVYFCFGLCETLGFKIGIWRFVLVCECDDCWIGECYACQKTIQTGTKAIKIFLGRISIRVVVISHLLTIDNPGKLI